ncbi:MAG: ABC transporter permease [Planctomycetota bacterium]|jgi:ABC-type lipoprotein release transport system permease subunit
MFPFFVSTRYLKTRLIAAISALAIACAVVIAYVPNPVMEGFLTELKAKVRGTSADVLVQTRDLFDADELEVQIRALDSRIEAVSPRMEGNLIFSTGDEVDNFDFGQVFGVDPEKEAAVSHFGRYLENGGTSREKPFELKAEVLLKVYRRRAAEVALGKEAVASMEGGDRIRALRALARDSGMLYYADEKEVDTLAGKIEKKLLKYGVDPAEAKVEAATEARKKADETRNRLTRSLAEREGRKALSRLDGRLAAQHIAQASLPDGIEETGGFQAELTQLRRRPGVVVGKSLVDNWKELHLGEEIELLSGSFSGPLDTQSPPKGRNRIAVIVGLYDSGFYEWDVRTLYMSLKDTEEFLGDISPVRSLGVKLADWRKAEEVRQVLQASLGPSGFSVTTWRQQKEVVLEAVKRQKDVLFVILFFADIVAGFGIFITLRILVAEKIRDIGIFTAIGASPYKIMGTFILTGLTIALLGAAAGVGAGMLIVSQSNEIVSALSWMGLTEFKTYVEEIQHLKEIPVEYRLDTLVKILGATLVSALLFSLYPAFLAARLKPVDAIRREFL